MPKPKLMLTTDMVDTAVDTDMADTVDTAVDITVASDLPLPKLIPMLKPKLTVTVMAVDTDMEVMVDTVVMEVTDMVDTVARGPLMPMPMLRLTMVDTMVDTDTVDTVMAVDTVMVVIVDITTE